MTPDLWTTDPLRLAVAALVALGLGGVLGRAACGAVDWWCGREG